MVEVSYTKLLKTMAALSRVEKLLNKKRSIESELTQIRRECKHNEQQIAMVPHGPGCQMEIRWLCVNCAETLGYPTESEVDHYVRKK
jgi:hypothetical protein